MPGEYLPNDATTDEQAGRAFDMAQQRVGPCRGGLTVRHPDEPRIVVNMLRALAAVLALPAALCVLVLLSACGAPQGGSTIQIGISDFPGYELLYLAQEKGFYRDEGVAVRIVEFTSLSDLSTAVSNNQIDAAAWTLEDLVIQNETSRGTMKAGWVIDYSTGADVILSGAHVRNVADLRGRRVGLETSSVGLFVLGRALQLHSIDLKDVQLVDMEPVSGEVALPRGEIDASVSYAPYSERLAKKPGIRKIFDSRAIPGEVIDVLTFSSNLITTRQADIQRVIRAYQRAQSFLRDQPEQAIAIMAQREHLEPLAFRRALENDLRLLTWREQAAYLRAGGLLEQQIRRTTDFLQSVSRIQDAPEAREMIFDSFRSPGNGRH